MNEKKAKLARKIAASAAANVPEERRPKAPYLRHPNTGVISNHPYTFRGFYRQIKRNIGLL